MHGVLNEGAFVFKFSESLSQRVWMVVRLQEYFRYSLIYRKLAFTKLQHLFEKEKNYMLDTINGMSKKKKTKAYKLVMSEVVEVTFTQQTAVLDEYFDAWKTFCLLV